MFDLTRALASTSLAVYETVRSPQRQAELYAIGRQTAPRGKTVTRARAWESYHQYGLAADFVFSVNGKWTWTEPKFGQWKEFTLLAAKCGLRSLSFERPHVEFPDTQLSKLMSGQFPANGGDTWQEWLETQIEQWGQHARNVGGITHPAAPSLGAFIERPASEDIGS